jgi:leader peptidase (prepilin peptidase)/N-methyltransferase
METPFGLVYKHPVPLWLMVLSGVFLGYLVGGGIVWVTRIFGTLGFGKEAMGLGDVHMMAAVGACLGWVDAVLGFFAAAIVGTVYALLGTLFSGVFKRAMPFGPYLAIGTVLVWFAKPAVEALLTWLAKADPPINLP